MPTQFRTRREHMRYVASLPDAQIRIKWGRIAAILLGLSSMIGTSLMFAWWLNMFIDTL